MGNAIQTAVVKIIGTLDPSVAKSVADANKQFSGLKAGIVATGAVLAGATIAAVAFGKTSLDAAAKFETGMSNIATLLDGDTATVNKRIAEMGDDIMGVAKKTGVATDDLSNGMYQIVSALGDSKDATSQLEVAAKAAKAGGATTVDAINLLSAVTKGYGDTSGEAWSKASDLAFQTVKLGQTSFPELASSMGKVVPIASALNISQEELFGSFATLTGVTGSTAEVATQMKSVFAGLMTPSKQLSETISSLGYSSANAMLDELGLIGTLDKLTAACGDDKQAVAKLFSSVEAQTAILALAGAQTENWVQKTEAMAGAADATSKAFDKQTDNLQGKLDRMKQVFETFKIRVGNILIPIVTNIVDKAIPKIEKAFNNIVPVISKVYIAAKPLIEAFGNAIPGVIQIAGGAFEFLFGVIRAIIPVLNGIGKVISFLGNHLNVVIPIVGALTAAFITYKAVVLACNIAEKVRYQQTLAMMAGQKLSTAAALKMVAVQKIQAASTKLVAGAQKVLNAVMSANPIGIVIAAVVALGTAFVLLYKKCEPFRNFINGIGAGIKNGFMAAVEWFKGLPQILGNIFSNMFSSVKNIISENKAIVITALVNPFTLYKVAMLGAKAVTLAYIVAEKIKTAQMKISELWAKRSIVAEKLKAAQMKISELWARRGAVAEGLKVAKLKLYELWTKKAIIAEKARMVAANAAMLATKVWTGIQAVFNAVANANPVMLIVTGIWALVAAFVVLYKKCEPFRNFINGIGAAIKNTFLAVVEWFKGVPTRFGAIVQSIGVIITPYIDGIKNAISSIKNVFTSLIDFIKNVFTGNWSAAWESVKSIFGNAFSALTGLAKAPLNAVISLINRAIGGLNSLHVSIPDWVPGFGGKEFGINIPQIPMLATGGIATQPSICGEGGYPEYVISTDPKYREQNQKTVLEAASAIGALETARNEGSSVRSLFKKFNGKGNSSTVNNNNESTAYRIEFSPVINISGNTNNARSIADEVMKVFDDYQGELADKIKAVLATAREGSYGI